MDSFSQSKLLVEFCEEHLIDANTFSRNYRNCYQALKECLVKQVSLRGHGQPIIVGLSAPQGAGKTTLVEFFK